MWNNLDGGEADKRRHERDEWMRQAGENAAAADRLARENDALKAENGRLRVAFHDAIRRPLGVTPDSGAEFYDSRMADEAEARRRVRTLSLPEISSF